MKRRIAGAVLFAIPFIVATVWMVHLIGWRDLLIVLGIPVVMAACVVGGAILMADGGRK